MDKKSCIFTKMMFLGPKMMKICLKTHIKNVS
eukprot:UN28180